MPVSNMFTSLSLFHPQVRNERKSQRRVFWAMLLCLTARLRMEWNSTCTLKESKPLALSHADQCNEQWTCDNVRY